MKNNDILYIQKIIGYCDIVDSHWVNMKEIMQYFNHQNLFSYQQAYALFKLENMFQDCLMNLNKNMMRFLGEKSKA